MKLDFKHDQSNIYEAFGMTEERFDDITNFVAMADASPKLKRVTQEMEWVIEQSKPTTEMELAAICFMVGTMAGRSKAMGLVKDMMDEAKQMMRAGESPSSLSSKRDIN